MDIRISSSLMEAPTTYGFILGTEMGRSNSRASSPCPTARRRCFWRRLICVGLECSISSWLNPILSPSACCWETRTERLASSRTTCFRNLPLLCLRLWRRWRERRWFQRLHHHRECISRRHEHNQGAWNDQCNCDSLTEPLLSCLLPNGNPIRSTRHRME